MYLAIKAGVPLVPVAIMGTHEILAKGKCMVRSGSIAIRVGKPIDTRAFTLKQKQELAETVQQAVADLMKEA
jgi:1-acyl-sn-glycerol-3-phosphate acyltransferase